MAINANQRNDYVGNGAAATYPYTFKIFAETDLQVTVRDTTGSQSTLHWPTDFSVTGVGLSAGGSITLTSGNLTSGWGLTIKRVRPFTQGTALSNQSAYQADTHENTFDSLTMLAQHLKDITDRALKVSESLALGLYTLDVPTPEANKALGWDPTGKVLMNLLTNVVTPVSMDSLSATFLQAGAGATSRNVRDRLRESISVKDFGAVGDGIADDTVAIQAALTAAPSTATGIVYLPRGSYLISATLTIPTGITLEGQGRASQILVASGGGSYGSSDVYLLYVNSVSNVILRDFRLTGAGKAYPGADAIHGDGIYVYRSSNVEISGLEIENVNCGIDAVSSNYGRYHDNYVHGYIAQDAIRMFAENGQTSQFNCVQANILRNDSHSPTFTGIRSCGFSMTYASRYNAIIGNTIDGVSNYGNEGLHGQCGEYDAWIGNTVLAMKYGLSFYGNNYSTVQGNTFNGCSNWGIGIVTASGSFTSDHNRISGNVVNNCGSSTGAHAVSIRTGSGISADFNSLSDNVIVGANVDCIHIGSSHSTTVQGNLCITAGRYGIFVDSGADDTDVIGNKIIDPTSDGISTSNVNRLNLNANTVRLTTGALGTTGINSNAVNSVCANNQVSGFVTSIVFSGAGSSILNNSDHTQDVLKIGAAPAQTGVIRLPNNVSLIFRNSADNADLAVLTVDGSNLTIFGNTTSRAALRSGDFVDCQKPLNFTEQTAPAAPAADTVTIYAQDNGSGKTQLMAKFATGAAQQLAIQP